MPNLYPESNKLRNKRKNWKKEIFNEYNIQPGATIHPARTFCLLEILFVSPKHVFRRSLSAATQVKFVIVLYIIRVLFFIHL